MSINKTNDFSNGMWLIMSITQTIKRIQKLNNEWENVW